MRIYTSSASFTRPNDTTAYAQFDLVANSTTAASVVPMTFSSLPQGFMLTNVKLNINSPANVAATNPQFYLHLFQFTPTAVTNGDNGAIFVTESGYLGSVYLDCTQVSTLFGGATSNFSPTVYDAISSIDPNTIPIFLDTTPGLSGPAGNVYGLLMAWGAFAPQALEVFTVTLIGVD